MASLPCSPICFTALTQELWQERVMHFKDKIWNDSSPASQQHPAFFLLLSFGLHALLLSFNKFLLSMINRTSVLTQMDAS